ncbi:MAG: hypothetical protein ABSF46_31625 [Terriglobia bacterium]|jgi:hypothetical protein
MKVSRVLLQGALLLTSLSLAGNIRAADPDHDSNRFPVFWPGNLVVSRSVYDNLAGNVTIGQQLPPGCTSANCVSAQYNGLFPYIFNNAPIDGSFGITSRIFLDQLTVFGWPIHTLEIPNSLQPWITGTSDQLVTSFSSKSELALHLSTDHQYLTFIGYVAPVNALDVSNANTPLVVDPSNPDPQTFYRAVAQVDKYGNFQFTETNAYSGDNGRAAILSNLDGQNFFFTAGNAGNGGTPQPTGVVLGAGAQIIDPLDEPESEQSPGLPTPVGAFSVTELGRTADKVGKDDNYRAVTVFDNVVYYAKGSGGNGVNTVYFVDTTGSACPNGVGLPSPSATLPNAPFSAYDPTTGTPTNMCILAGFPTVSAKKALNYPFGIWFANSTTLYVADEGDGYVGGTDLYTHAAAQTTAGLEKWVFNSSTSQWTLAYTLQNGLNLGVPYNVPGFPVGTNAATGLPWAPATDGLRNLTGFVGPWGGVTIWAITSTISGDGDTGADSNRLVVIQDSLANTDPSAAAHESFFTLRTAGFAEVLRGVSFTPGSE